MVEPAHRRLLGHARFFYKPILANVPVLNPIEDSIN
jgi:hypothetical protein